MTDLMTGADPDLLYARSTTPTANTRGSTVRTDFIDYPTGWEIQREIGMKLEHDPRCSSVPQADVPLAGPAFLCDCAAMPTEWARRAIELEPEREHEIRVALQRYLPEHMRDPALTPSATSEQTTPLSDDTLGPAPGSTHNAPSDTTHSDQPGAPA